MGRKLNGLRDSYRRRLLAAGTGILIAAGMATMASPVYALTATSSLAFSGAETLQGGSFTARCDSCVPGSNTVGARLKVSISATWNPPATIIHSYTSSFLRQGQTLDLADSLTPGSGPLTITWAASGDAGIYNTDSGSGPVFPQDGSQELTVSGSTSATATTPCTLKLDGDGGYSCAATTAPTVFEVDLGTFEGVGLGHLLVMLPITTTVTITPDAVVTVRTALAGGQILAFPSSIVFHGPSPSTVADPIGIPCTVPTGTDLLYGLSPNVSAPTTSTSTSVHLLFHFTGPIPDQNFDLGQVGPNLGTLALSAPGVQTDLGPVLPDLNPPVADPGGGATHTYAGVEGSGVMFDGSASSDPHCGPPALSWDFGDGSTGTGTTPLHSYSEEGTFTGHLTATNAAGLQSTTAFTVNVADAPLNATGVTLVAANPVSGTVATFVDTDGTNTISDSNQNPADYTAAIDWGDGSTSSGTVAPNGIGFNIQGTHTYASSALGPHALSVTIHDVGGSMAQATSSLLAFDFLQQGGFTIGDGNSNPGTAVTFWSDQWSKANQLSGGAAPASFKGFAESPSSTPPPCSGSWTTDPANLAGPPTAVPSYMGVIVSSSISMSGSSISGDVHAVVVVKTDPGYEPFAGHPGTGTVVAVFCHL